MTCFSERNPIWGKRNRNICWICWKRYIGRRFGFPPWEWKASKVAGEKDSWSVMSARWVMDHSTVDMDDVLHQAKDINCFYGLGFICGLASHLVFEREELWEWVLFYRRGAELNFNSRVILSLGVLWTVWWLLSAFMSTLVKSGQCE